MALGGEATEAPAATGEPVVDPARPIIDPHHHLWDRPGQRYLMPEFAADVATGHDIRASVFIECGAMYRQDGPEELRPVGEAEFAAGMAAMAASGLYGKTRTCAGIIGFADLRQPSVLETVVEAEREASGGRLRGMRHSACWDADPTVGNKRSRAPKGLLHDPAFRDGFARLPGLGLTFEAWMFHPQLPEFLDLVRAVPVTTVVVNHCGGLLGSGGYAGRRTEIFPRWQSLVRELASLPGVYIKLGGLGMPICGFDFDRRPVRPSSDELVAAWAPYIETCIEAFGPGRCMFESNFPVDKHSCDYAVLWNAYKKMTAGCSESEKTALFSGTANTVYRLGLA